MAKRSVIIVSTTIEHEFIDVDVDELAAMDKDPDDCERESFLEEALDEGGRCPPAPTRQCGDREVAKLLGIEFISGLEVVTTSGKRKP